MYSVQVDSCVIRRGLRKNREVSGFEFVEERRAKYQSANASCDHLSSESQTINNRVDHHSRRRKMNPCTYKFGILFGLAISQSSFDRRNLKKRLFVIVCQERSLGQRCRQSTEPPILTSNRTSR